jgi:carbon storage regulator
MLVLSRKKGESIRIGNDIVVTIQRLSGNRVSVGIEAPPHCRISRGELKTLLEELEFAPQGEVPARAATVASSEPTRSINSDARRNELRGIRNTLPSTTGENRIAAHLPPSLRAPK